MEIDDLKYPFSTTRNFIPEFVTRMRKIREVIDKPSPRQSKAMFNLLLISFLKKGYLSLRDLIIIAVKTSKVENQIIAEKVANEILLDVNEREISPYEENKLSGLQAVESDNLISFLKSELEKESTIELEARYDSDVDIFKRFTSKPDLGIGPGEDELLKEGIRKVKNQGGERSKRILAEFLKVNLLKLGRDFERSIEFLQNPKLRPFEPGDDPELIDEERSLENIFDLGRKIDEVRYGDFLIRKKSKKRKSIVYIQDISNTMFYELNSINSIQFSIMSLIPLLWALRREKYGLILYESNSHVQKEIYEDFQEDGVINSLLSLVTSTTSEVEKTFGRTRGSRTWGGTVPNSSLRWALDQFEEAGERNEKLCFYFSDFVIDEPDNYLPDKMDNYLLIEEMIGRGIQVLACVSPLAYGEQFAPYTEHSLSRIKETGCEIIETKKPIDFLEKVKSILETSLVN